MRPTDAEVDAALAQHIMTRVFADGLYCSWRCERPGSSVCAFEVTLIPRYLLVTGDLGELIVHHPNEANMLPWAMRAVHSLDYFAGKVRPYGSCRQHSPRVMAAWLRENNLELLAQQVEAGDISVQAALEKSVDAWVDEPPDVYEYTSAFLWLHGAVRWFVRKLESENH